MHTYVVYIHILQYIADAYKYEHRLYTPYGCEIAARACRFVLEPTVSILISRF